MAIRRGTWSVKLLTLSLVPLTCSGVWANGGGVYTPRKGGAERKAILAPPRVHVTRPHHLNLVFVVTWMKVRDGWSWTSVMPQSRDGTQRYEDVPALLHKSKGAWKVLEMPCTEPENPACLGDPTFFAGLKRRFPGLPDSILPE